MTDPNQIASIEYEISVGSGPRKAVIKFPELRRLILGGARIHEIAVRAIIERTDNG